MRLNNEKIIVHLLQHLLKEAHKITGLQIDLKTLKTGIKTKSYNKLTKLHDRYKFSVELAELGKDRDLN